MSLQPSQRAEPFDAEAKLQESPSLKQNLHDSKFTLTCCSLSGRSQEFQVSQDSRLTGVLQLIEESDLFQELPGCFVARHELGALQVRSAVCLVYKEEVFADYLVLKHVGTDHLKTLADIGLTDDAEVNVHVQASPQWPPGPLAETMPLLQFRKCPNRKAAFDGLWHYMDLLKFTDDETERLWMTI